MVNACFELNDLPAAMVLFYVTNFTKAAFVNSLSGLTAPKESQK